MTALCEPARPPCSFSRCALRFTPSAARVVLDENEIGAGGGGDSIRSRQRLPRSTTGRILRGRLALPSRFFFSLPDTSHFSRRGTRALGAELPAISAVVSVSRISRRGILFPSEISEPSLQSRTPQYR